MTEILWEDPPPTTAKRRAQERNEQILQALKDNPGRWAKVASDVSIGSANTWLRAGCEVKRARTSENRANIWARCPETETESEPENSLFPGIPEVKRREIIEHLTHKLEDSEGQTLHAPEKLARQCTNWVLEVLTSAPSDV